MRADLAAAPRALRSSATEALRGALGGSVAVGLALALTARAAEISPADLFSARGLAAAARLLRGLWPPDLHGEFLAYVAPLVGETVALSLLGVGLACLLALPLVILGTGTLTHWGPLTEMDSKPRRASAGAAYIIARAILNTARAVPEIAWAIVFITIVGLGPFAGVLALGITYAGMVGKVIAEVFEAVDVRPLEALQSAGASRLQILLYGILPQAYPDAVSFLLYVWDCTMRAATILGIVGAGGVGYALFQSINVLQFGQVTTLLVVMLGLVALTDGVSIAVRATYVSSNAARAPRVAPPAWLALAIGAAAMGASVAFLHIDLGALFTQHALTQLGTWAHKAFPPELSPTFLAVQLPALWQTLAIAWWSTVIAVVFSGPLSLLATATLTLTRRLLDVDVDTVAIHWFGRLLFWSARGLLSLLRAVPELIWALLAILIVGPGAFAGVIALTIHTTGVLGKLFADVLENCEPRPLELLAGAGASRGAIVAFGMLPAVLPQLLTHAIYRFEMNVRAAAVIGIVGAGGIGQAIYNDAQIGHYHELVTLILLTLVLVGAVDGVSSALRRRIV